MKKSVAEAHRMLSNTYGEAAISERMCGEWFQRFKNGDFDVGDQHGILVVPARRSVLWLLKRHETSVTQSLSDAIIES
ncbi:hypothetical protein TNCV_136931 [Trichonephila clavipes]|nr:hypothetical protein TNCV_136931 [Trichonephila clavipes]